MAPPVSAIRCVECNKDRWTRIVRPLSGNSGKPGVCYVCAPPRERKPQVHRVGLKPPKKSLAQLFGVNGTSASWAELSDNALKGVHHSKPCSQCGEVTNKLWRDMCMSCARPARIKWGMEANPEDTLRAQELRKQAEGVAKLDEFMRSFQSPRCICCGTSYEVSLDSAGTPWCRLCASSAFQCGRCVYHDDTQVFFPALLGNPAPERKKSPQTYIESETPVDCEEPA